MVPAELNPQRLAIDAGGSVVETRSCAAASARAIRRPGRPPDPAGAPDRLSTRTRTLDREMRGRAAPVPVPVRVAAWPIDALRADTVRTPAS
ncbi:hypothetical protein GCM10017688_44370 [Streptomyces ramulosus]